MASELADVINITSSDELSNVIRQTEACIAPNALKCNFQTFLLGFQSGNIKNPRQS